MKLRAILAALCVVTLALCGAANAKGPRMHRCKVHYFADCEATFASPGTGNMAQCPVIFGESVTSRRACNANLNSNLIYSQKPFPQRRQLPQLVNGQWVNAPLRIKQCQNSRFIDCVDVLCNIPNPDGAFVLANCSCSQRNSDSGFVTSAQSCQGDPSGIPIK